MPREEDRWADAVAGMMQRAREDLDRMFSDGDEPPVETDLRVLVRNLAHDFAAKSKLAGGWLLLQDSAMGCGREASTPNGTVLDAAALDVANLLAAVRVTLGPATEATQIRVMVLWSETDGTYQFQYCAVSMHHKYAEELMWAGDSSSAWANRAAEHGIVVHTIEGSLYD